MKNEPMDRRVINKYAIIRACLFIGVVIAFFVFVISVPHPAQRLMDYLREEANMFFYAILMAFLPLASVPFTIFLIPMAMVYGLAAGIALTGILIFFHLVMSYCLAHSFLRPLVLRILQRFKIAAPTTSWQGTKRMAFLFMIIPGFPYAMKNYVLALTEIPLHHYLLISWPAQFLLSLPAIILGEGVFRMNLKFVVLALIALLLIIAGGHSIRRRYNPTGRNQRGNV